MRMIQVCIIALGVAFVLGGPARSSGPIAVDHLGIKVFDGDTIQIDSHIWQLSGIDAPELGQVCGRGGHLWRCGVAAAYKLRKLISFKSTPINCYPKDDAPGQATCMIGDLDMSIVLIESGYAVSTAKSPLMYAMAEKKARQASLGIWGGPFVYPLDWREGSRLNLESASDGANEASLKLPWGLDATLNLGRVGHSECTIKGIREAGRQRLYYGLLDVGYSNMEINPERGDRLFCSDDEARLAGWRHQGETEMER